MAFNPSSTIYLCNVPIDSTYKNQIWFGNKTAQFDYFFARADKIFTDYLTVRKTKPDGSLQSSVRVNNNIDDLYGCNYMFYQNEHHGTKWFYAFITNLVYINEGTTEIVFETDVFQTWLFDVEVLPSYVAREHSTVDIPGDNVVPEPFNFDGYHFYSVFDDSSLTNWGYLITSTHDLDDSGFRGKRLSGVYQGLYFYYYDNVDYVGAALDQLEDEGGDCIVSVSLIPEFCVENSIDEDEGANRSLVASRKPNETDIDIDMTAFDITFGGYTPKNQKLYTAPFYKLIVTNHSGQQAEYNFEDFDRPLKPSFRMYGDVSANPSITLCPLDYKGLGENIDEGISIQGFPQCSTNTDSYKLWLAKNQFGIALDVGSSIANLAMGATLSASGIGAGFGGMQLVAGASGVLSTVNSVYQAKKQPNSGQAGSPKNNLLTAMGQNKFDYYVRTIKREYAITIDAFFTMYGYQVNRIKVPNFNTRPCWNYVQTVDVNISGGIPGNDMERLKQMYNNGVTFWRGNVTVGDYSQDNSVL